MRIRLTVGSVFVVVTACALLGMMPGGGFGYWAGHIAPDLFFHVFSWKDFEPVGVATVIGATAGVICGGGLGAFAVVMQWLGQWAGAKGGIG